MFILQSVIDKRAEQVGATGPRSQMNADIWYDENIQLNYILTSYPNFNISCL